MGISTVANVWDCKHNDLNSYSTPVHSVWAISDFFNLSVFFGKVHVCIITQNSVSQHKMYIQISRTKSALFLVELRILFSQNEPNYKTFVWRERCVLKHYKLGVTFTDFKLTTCPVVRESWSKCNLSRPVSIPHLLCNFIGLIKQNLANQICSC